MKYSLLSAGLLSLCLSQSFGWSISAQTPTLLAVPAAKTSSFCQQESYQRAFTRWSELSEWLISKAEAKTDVPPTVLAEMLPELARAGQTPKLAQLAIDRLTTRAGGYDDLQKQPLLNLMERLPAGQQQQILPIVERLLMLARSLPGDYALAQARSRITAAHAYQQLGQRDRALVLLNQASQILPRVRGAQLAAEAELRLAEAWFALEQPAPGIAALDRGATQAVAMYRTKQGSNPELAERLVSNYLQQRQFSKAREFAQKLPPEWDGGIQLFRVAIAYHQAQQPQVAEQLFNQTVQRLLQARRPDNPSDIPLATGAIQFAQLGELTWAARAAQQIPAEVPHLRARVWLAIAGEARKRNQPQLATQAMNPMLAAGKLGAKQNFGMGFGDQRDYEWSQELYALSRKSGYEPEMVQFIQRMNLQSEGAEFLIEQALQAKQFDQAKQLVPIPMQRAIDAGVFEVQNQWLERVAKEAARAGQVAQALQLAQTQPTNVGMLVRLAEPLQQGGNSAEADRLIGLAVQQAAQLDNQPGKLYELASMISALQYQKRTQEANQVLQILQTRLQTVTNPAEQRDQLFKVHSWGGLNLDTWLQLAQRLGLDNQPEVRQFLVNQSFTFNRLDLVERFATAPNQPADQVEWLVNLGELSLKQQKPTQAIALFDRALEIAPRAKVAANSYPNWWSALPNAYLKFNQPDKAMQAAQAIGNPDQRTYQLKRLACY